MVFLCSCLNECYVQFSFIEKVKRDVGKPLTMNSFRDQEPREVTHLLKLHAYTSVFSLT